MNQNENHYQKIYEYKQNHQQKYSVGILVWYLPTELIPSSFLSMFTDEIFLLVNIEGIPVEIKGILKNYKAR